MNVDLSVIICAHNPRPDYLTRVLDALKGQTLPLTEWELLLIDNASTEPLVGSVDVSWHPHSRHIWEEELGLTPARLRGIREAKADLLVFVDDDNILAADYLEQAGKIGERFPTLGTWGGSCRPDFEVPPDPSLEIFLPTLGLREITRSKWSNYDFGSLPLGAGMCVRSSVGRKYVESASNDPMKIALDRRGTNLAGGGDFDLAMTSCALGYGTGIFPELNLTHLISKERVEPDYLYRICVESTLAVYIVQYLHTGVMPPRPSWKRRLYNRLRQYVGIKPSASQRAGAEGLRKALEWMRQMNGAGSV